MSDAAPALLWIRRDFRLSDNPALRAAIEDGPVVPVFVLDPETESMGAAPRWRLGLAIEAFSETLRAKGSRLVLRRGEAGAELTRLAQETGARGVHLSRIYDRTSRTRDEAALAALGEAGLETRVHPGHLLHEPENVETKSGGPFKVFTPFWNSIGPRGVADPLATPRHIPAPSSWPRSDRLADWGLGAAMNRGAEVVGRHVVVGEAAASERLHAFLDGPARDYARGRDRPDRAGTSGLSENLTWGEISPRTIWHAATGEDAFLRELGWREFAAHVHWHDPELGRRNWRREWDGFPWRRDNADAEAWRRGMTGEPLVDAAMRELFVTGRMHNRMRMLAASYLTKHLLTDWRVGLRWFEETLVDWDAASNALNWQWVAGSGPDAAPYFRVFSPERQAERFDPAGAYRARFLDAQSEDAQAFFAAAPRSWKLDPGAPAPEPRIAAAEGRKRALAAYEAFR